jgi:DNA-binding transcriptional regulator LsrR (DeoR family)
MSEIDWAKKAKAEFEAMPAPYQLDWAELRKLVTKS